MHIYFSGVGGVGLGPLAEIALDAGYEISGSDLHASVMTEQLTAQGVTVHIGQDGQAIATEHETHPIDWFVYTAALPDNHPELVFAHENGIKTSKRDELLATILLLVSAHRIDEVESSHTFHNVPAVSRMHWSDFARRCFLLSIAFNVASIPITVRNRRMTEDLANIVVLFASY
jgi:UDP-N-acetylmuramate--alanine ligase